MRRRLGVCLFVWLLIGVTGSGVRTQAPEDGPSFPAIDDHFKYGSVGTEAGVGIPYWVWRVLPIVFEDRLPDRPGEGWETIGFLDDGAGHGRPIGTSYREDTFVGSGRSQLRHLSHRDVPGVGVRTSADSCWGCRPIRWTCRSTDASWTASSTIHDSRPTRLARCDRRSESGFRLLQATLLSVVRDSNGCVRGSSTDVQISGSSTTGLTRDPAAWTPSTPTRR